MTWDPASSEYSGFLTNCFSTNKGDFWSSAKSALLSPPTVSKALSISCHKPSNSVNSSSTADTCLSFKYSWFCSLSCHSLTLWRNYGLGKEAIWLIHDCLEKLCPRCCPGEIRRKSPRATNLLGVKPTTFRLLITKRGLGVTRKPSENLPPSNSSSDGSDSEKLGKAPITA